MKDTTRRVVILKNIDSDFIEETILILKDSAESGDSRLLQEAEKIVEKYMGTHKAKKQAAKKSLPPLALYLGAAILGVGIMLILFFA